MSSSAAAPEETQLPLLRSRLRDLLTAPPRAEELSRGRADESTYRIGKTTAFCLAGLFLLTILPRILLALRLDAVCDDAYYYISVADAWDRGDIEAALQYLNINVYPLIIWGLHTIGFDWVVGAQAWGVLVSGLTILPMFGLIRRLYDDRIALATCFLFAIHPEFIESSIEPIRGPTFWFFFVLSLYVIWRTVNSDRLGWFLVCGLCITLAIHTRAEGWILLVPFGLWLILLRRPERRLLKQSAGALVVAASIPALVFAVNVTILQERDEWEWGRFTHFRNFYEWVRRDISKENIHVSERKPRPWSVELAAPPPAPQPPPKPQPRPAAQKPAPQQPAPHKPPAAVAQQSPPAAQPQPEPQPARVEVTPEILAAANPPAEPPPEAVRNPLTDGRGFTYLQQFVRKFEPMNLVFMLFGLCGWWRVMFHRDKIVLLIVYLGLMAAIWIRLAQIGDMNGRYFLSPLLVALPMAGIGLQWALHRLWNGVERLRRHHPLRAAAVPLGLLVALTAFGFVDSLTATHNQRRAQAKLGEWLNRELGPFDSVLVDRAATRVGYFAHGTMPTVSYYFSSSGDGSEYAMPDLLIVTRKLSKPHERVFLYGQVARMQLQPVNVDVIPHISRGYLVFAKRQPRSKSYVPQLANRDKR